MLVTLLPLQAAAVEAARRGSPRPTSVAALPTCAADPAPPAEPGSVVEPWQTVLDEEGAVTGHHVTLRRQGQDVAVETGPRGFATDVGTDRLLVGERTESGSDLALLDIGRSCWLWQRTLEEHVYDPGTGLEEGRIRLSAHEPLTRLFEGTLVLDAETGATEALIDGQCSTACEPNDGDLPPAAFQPAGPPRPVPVFTAGGWPSDKALPYAWGSSAVPPKWARKPIHNGADDTRRSSHARTPIFRFDSGSSDTIRYTAAFPTFCRFGIACASRSMPSLWAVWIRPHGTDFSWGTLRWCQKPSGDGCFDLRRVMIHELGHVTGLNHPESAGFRLAVGMTVMQAITPARPKAGSNRHSYGPCDVASLQELYDIPDRETRISTCNDLVTSLRLWSSTSSVSPGGSVKLNARLRVADRGAYGRLGGKGLDGRSVKLKYRRAGSDDSWTTAWMKPRSGVGRYELSIAPGATWEFQATFPAPVDEGLRFSASEVVKVKVQA